MIKKSKVTLIVLFFLLFSYSFAQNISEFTGEIKYDQAGGYYILSANGTQYALINVPRQPGQIQEGQYYVMGFPTLEVQDPSFSGPVPFQVTKMDYKGPSQSSQNLQVASGDIWETTGYIFLYNKGSVPTYVLSVLGQNNTPVYYPIVNYPPQPGIIEQGLYKVRAIKSPSLQNPIGTGIPLQIILCQSSGSQSGQDSQQQNGVQEYLGNVLFMPLGDGAGMGYYVLQTQDNQQYTLVNLPQQEGKYQAGYYKVMGKVTPGTTNPYGFGTPMEVSGITLITPLPGMDNSTMDPSSLFNLDGDDDQGDDGGW